jgi:hypothetical protein
MIITMELPVVQNTETNVQDESKVSVYWKSNGIRERREEIETISSIPLLLQISNK